jgi:transcription initiation factor IIE alpha subunit
MRRERYFEEDFNGFVEELINSSRLEGMEAGIAKLMLDKGYDSLSEKQKFVFDRAIEKNTVDECQRCGVDIPWCEMLEALDNGGYCGYCQYMMEKMNEE